MASLSLASIVYGNDNTVTTWPPSMARLVKSYICGSMDPAYPTPIHLCAIYLYTGGVTGVACATSGDAGLTNLQKFNCTLSGSQQVCTPGETHVNMSDTPAIKCQKVCAPNCTEWH